MAAQVFVADPDVRGVRRGNSTVHLVDMPMLEHMRIMCTAQSLHKFLLKRTDMSAAATAIMGQETHQYRLGECPHAAVELNDVGLAKLVVKCIAGDVIHIEGPSVKFTVYGQRSGHLAWCKKNQH